MRVALVNNGTKEPSKVRDLLSGHEVIEFSIEEADEVLGGAFDLIVLSGSSRFPIVYNLEQLRGELRLITESTAPLLGICFGAELLAVAYGGTLVDMGHKVKGIYTIEAGTDSLFKGRTSFDVYEAHRWSIGAVPESLHVLAHSERGPEIIRHTQKPQYGFQFHPEKMCDETYGDELFSAFLAEVGCVHRPVQRVPGNRLHTHTTTVGVQVNLKSIEYAHS